MSGVGLYCDESPYLCVEDERLHPASKFHVLAKSMVSADQKERVDSNRETLSMTRQCSALLIVRS